MGTSTTSYIPDLTPRAASSRAIKTRHIRSIDISINKGSSFFLSSPQIYRSTRSSKNISYHTHRYPEYISLSFSKLIDSAISKNARRNARNNPLKRHPPIQQGHQRRPPNLRLRRSRQQRQPRKMALRNVVLLINTHRV